MNQSVTTMVDKICGVLAESNPSIYLYGSSVLGDFKLGWSDIDILVLTQRSISQEQAETLVTLRQTMLEHEPTNPYYRLFEGGMLSLSAFINGGTDRVVYWGTSGQRITDRYSFDSFGMTQLLENGILLYGQDVRHQLIKPSYFELYADVKRHYETIRKYVQKTDRSLYSFGWLLDISRCIYTLRTGKIIAKTNAGEWALKENLFADRDALIRTLDIRKNPDQHKNNTAVFDYAETLGECVQRCADVLADELKISKNDTGNRRGRYDGGEERPGTI